MAGFTEAPCLWQSLARRMFSLRIQVLSSFQVRHLFFFAQPGALMVIGVVDGVGLSLLPCDWPSGGRGVIGSAGEEHPL